MNARKPLTGFSAASDPEPELAAALEDVGLELWQAPEGFWAIRLKPPAPAMRPRRSRGKEGRR